jgi:hypothetical protein
MENKKADICQEFNPNNLQKQTKIITAIERNGSRKELF